MRQPLLRHFQPGRIAAAARFTLQHLADGPALLLGQLIQAIAFPENPHALFLQQRFLSASDFIQRNRLFAVIVQMQNTVGRYG